MGKLVCSGAMLKCSFGMAPGTLNVLPLNCVMSGAPSANIMDNVPMMNIMPFGMCQSMANPMVAAATAAAKYGPCVLYSCSTAVVDVQMPFSRVPCVCVCDTKRV